MRSIQINFNSENKLPDGNCLGNKGEHNATELVITPPAEMLNSDKVKCFIIAFQVGAHRLFRSDVHEKNETISYKIPREVTVANMIAVQLEGYDSEEELIVKSDVIENLYFNNSICGEETDGEVSKSLSGEIAANTAARHTHKNADVLDNLADDNGTLKYNGNSIGGVTALKSKTYTVGVDGDITIDVTGPANIEFYISEPLENALLVGIRFTYNGEEVGTTDFLLNGAISGQDILEIFPIANNDYGMVARIVSGSGNASELAIQISSYQQPITAFTLYYLETNA